MRFQFNLPNGLEYEDYFGFVRLAYQKFPQRSVVRSRRFLCGMGVLCIAFGVFLAYQHWGRMGVGWTLLTGVMLLLGGWVVYQYGFSFFRFAALNALQKASAQRSAVTVTLDETGLENATETSSVRCAYTDIRHFYRTGGLRVLLSDQGAAFLLPDRALAVGEAEELDDFLRQATGCPVETV